LITGKPIRSISASVATLSLMRHHQRDEIAHRDLDIVGH